MLNNNTNFSSSNHYLSKQQQYDCKSTLHLQQNNKPVTSSAGVRCSVIGRLTSCVQNRRNSSCIMWSIMCSSSTSCELKCLQLKRTTSDITTQKSLAISYLVSCRKCGPTTLIMTVSHQNLPQIKSQSELWFGLRFT